MIVEFSDSALADEGSWPALSQIFELFVAGRHKWLVREWEVLLASDWYQGLGEAVRKRVRILERSTVTTERGVSRIVTVTSAASPAALTERELRMPAGEAKRYLAEPLHLVVEDGPSDGAFIRAVLLIFAERRCRARLGQSEFDQVKARWSSAAFGDGTFFRVISGGGSRIGDIMKGCFQSSPSSMLAIVDSDHPVPQHVRAPLPTTTWASALQAAADLAQSGPTVPTPVVRALSRRAMENYVPPAALKERYPQKSAWIDAYSDLGASHRAHLDVKGGLRASLEEGQTWQWRALSVGEFWEQVAEPRRELLLNGLGNKVSECWGCRAVHQGAMAQWAGQELNELVDAVLNSL